MTDSYGPEVLSLANARLAGMVTVERERRDGDPAEGIRAAAAQSSADVPIVGARGGCSGASGGGETAWRIVAAVCLLVPVDPVADLD